MLHLILELSSNTGYKKSSCGSRHFHLETRGTGFSLNKLKMSKEDKDSSYRQACSKITLQSKKEGFFQQLVETLSRNIDINTFARCSTDLERVKIVTLSCWNLIRAEPLYRGKKQEEAVARRVLGNQYFEKGDYQKALICYAQSIIQAPVGPDLVHVYSNRSALLQKMGEYELAITDAELAISYESPENTRYK